MEIKPIRRTSISDQVSMQIKQLILDKDWKPGERIPSETELAELFGVSRVSGFWNLVFRAVIMCGKWGRISI